MSIAEIGKEAEADGPGAYLKTIMKVKIQLTSEGAQWPKKAHDNDAGYDVFLPADTIVNPGRQVVPLNFKVDIESGYEMEMRPRSGFSCKGMEDYRGDRKDADVIIGTIDPRYHDIVGVIIKSNEVFPFRLAKGTRIAQVVFHKVESPSIEESEISETDGRGGGLHGKDLSKADVSVNIWCFLEAQRTGKEVKAFCAIGDDQVNGIPYGEIVETARQFIRERGGFEKFAEWGLF